MKKLRGLRRKVGNLGVWSLIPLFIAISIWTTVLPAFVSPTTLPEPTPQDKAAIQQAEASEAGKLLTSTGYKATIKISDPEIVKFLDGEIKRANREITNPGPYVVFSVGKPKTAAAEDNGTPDRVVDVSTGAMVALQEEFTNERGTICYNAQTIDILAGNWVVINQYLRGKSLAQLIHVKSDSVTGLTPNFPETNCYIYPTS